MPLYHIFCSSILRFQFKFKLFGFRSVRLVSFSGGQQPVASSNLPGKGKDLKTTVIRMISSEGFSSFLSVHCSHCPAQPKVACRWMTCSEVLGTMGVLSLMVVVALYYCSNCIILKSPASAHTAEYQSCLFFFLFHRFIHGMVHCSVQFISSLALWYT